MRNPNGSLRHSTYRDIARAWRKPLLALGAAALLVPATALAEEAVDTTAQEEMGSEQETEPAAEEQPRAPSRSTALIDVEELNDDAFFYAGKRVSVAGEVEDLRGGHAFVLESGGLLDDEITVIVPPSVRASVRGLEEDADLVVTGTVRGMRIIEIERELGLDLDPQLEVELEGVKYFLVAERIERQPAR